MLLPVAAIIAAILPAAVAQFTYSNHSILDKLWSRPKASLSFVCISGECPGLSATDLWSVQTLETPASIRVLSTNSSVASIHKALPKVSLSFRGVAIYLNVVRSSSARLNITWQGSYDIPVAIPPPPSPYYEANYTVWSALDLENDRAYSLSITFLDQTESDISTLFIQDVIVTQVTGEWRPRSRGVVAGIAISIIVGLLVIGTIFYLRRRLTKRRCRFGLRKGNNIIEQNNHLGTSRPPDTRPPTSGVPAIPLPPSSNSTASSPRPLHASPVRNFIPCPITPDIRSLTQSTLATSEQLIHERHQQILHQSHQLDGQRQVEPHDQLPNEQVSHVWDVPSVRVQSPTPRHSRVLSPAPSCVTSPPSHPPPPYREIDE